MIDQSIATMTEEEYLAFERAKEARHEFREGGVYEMTGITMRHRHIVMSSAMSLHRQVRGTDCNVLFLSMRTKVKATGMYAYPDIVAYCGKAQLEDSFEDTLLNPTVLIEVLSPSTAETDRGTKWVHYQEIESLQEYLIVWHDMPGVEHYIREGERIWRYRTTKGLEAVITLPSINCRLALSEVYESVSFGGDGS